MLGGLNPSTEYDKTIEDLDSYQDTKLRLVTALASSPTVSDMPFGVGAFLLLSLRAESSGNPRCAHVAFCIYDNNAGKIKTRVLTSNGWSLWKEITLS